MTDNRGSLLGWTGSIASTAFTATVNATTQTVAASMAKACIVVAKGPTLMSGTAVPSTTAIDPATRKVLGAAQAFVTATTAGNNVVAYTPSVQVTIDSTVVAATYSGTITHTVI